MRGEKVLSFLELPGLVPSELAPASRFQATTKSAPSVPQGHFERVIRWITRSGCVRVVRPANASRVADAKRPGSAPLPMGALTSFRLPPCRLHGGFAQLQGSLKWTLGPKAVFRKLQPVHPACGRRCGRSAWLARRTSSAAACAGTATRTAPRGGAPPAAAPTTARRRPPANRTTHAATRPRVKR